MIHANTGGTALPITLYDYQIECIETILKAREENSGLFRCGAMLPTGTGKTIIQLELVESLGKSKDVALIVPYDHLVTNAYDTLLLKYEPSDIGIVKAEKNEIDRPIQIVSIETVIRENRMELLAGKYNTIIVDEMHLFMTKRRQEAINKLLGPEATLIGFSATILRQDRIGLSQLFGKLVYQKPLWEMIARGYLCPLSGIRLTAKVDTTGINFNKQADVDGKMGSILSSVDHLKLIYEGWFKNAHDRVTIAFTPTIAMAQDCASYFSEKGISADWVCGAGEQFRRKKCNERLTYLHGVRRRFYLIVQSS